MLTYFVRKAIMAAFCLSIFCVSLFAQSSHGSIVGSIMTGATMPAATVILTYLASSGRRTVEYNYPRWRYTHGPFGEVTEASIIEPGILHSLF
jgi:hypothetical protein